MLFMNPFVDPFVDRFVNPIVNPFVNPFAANLLLTLRVVLSVHVYVYIVNLSEQEREAHYICDAPRVAKSGPREAKRKAIIRTY